MILFVKTQQATAAVFLMAEALEQVDHNIIYDSKMTGGTPEVRSDKDIPKISQRYPKDILKTSQRYLKDIPKISSKYPQNIPKISPRYQLH